MAFSNVATSDSYFLWLTKTNQVLSYLNQLDTTNILNFVSNNAPLSISAGTIKYGNTYIALDIKSDLNDANTKNIASMSSVNTVYQYARSVSTTANSAYNQANNGTTLANNAYIFANGVSTTVTSAYALANAQTITIASSYAAANAAGSPSAIAAAYNQANSAYTLANNAYIFANVVSTTVTSAYALANGHTTTLASAYNTANAASGIANTYATSVGASGNTYATSVGVGANTYTISAYAQANTGLTTAQGAFGKANTAANTTVAGISEFATAAEYRTGTDTVRSLVVDQVWAAGAEVTLTDAVTVTVDGATFINAVLTLGGNRTLGTWSNAKVGQSGYIRVVQDATGSRTLAYHADYEFASGTAFSLSTAINAQDMIFYQVIAAGRILLSITRAIS